jgi:hypothetical protein
MFRAIREKMFKTSKSTSACKNRRSRRLAFEGLEHRQLLTACVATAIPAASAAVPSLAGELQAAHTLLAEAKRDYDGHRAAADADVVKAMKQLGCHISPVPGPQPESQAVSDAQLAQARQILQQVVLPQMPSTSVATADLEFAIAQITMALTIK